MLAEVIMRIVEERTTGEEYETLTESIDQRPVPQELPPYMSLDGYLEEEV